MTDSLLPFALEYAAFGRPVFPLHGVWLGSCTCGRPTCPDPGKHPRTPHGLNDATQDPAQIREWWQRWPHANVGLRTGNGLVVLDVDDDRPLEGLPLTPTVTSGKGSHVYFTAAEPVGNRVALVPGVDLRGDRGYVVAPPSRHVNGATYQWRVTLEVPMAALPPWVLAKLAEPRTHALREQRHNNTHPTPSSDDSVILQGERNERLWRLGRKLRFKGWSAESITKKLHKVNAERCRPPLDPTEIEHLIQHVLSHPS